MGEEILLRNILFFQHLLYFLPFLILRIRNKTDNKPSNLLNTIYFYSKYCCNLGRGTGFSVIFGVCFDI